MIVLYLLSIYPLTIHTALEPATAPLKDLLFTLKGLHARYYVTGIFTVPDLQLSIFNEHDGLGLGFGLVLRLVLPFRSHLEDVRNRDGAF